MATRISRAQAARYLTHCNQQMADPTLSSGRRARLAEHADFYRRALAGSCTVCGRDLEDETQPGYSLGIGPECFRKILDQGDVDDRAYDRAVDHELSAR
ncbi:MAG: hypothetical protein M3Q68_08580 [Actinomycetota bacterium]|nr:hypothetical protein [Actinomycetota bacterium]